MLGMQSASSAFQLYNQVTPIEPLPCYFLGVQKEVNALWFYLLLYSIAAPTLSLSPFIRKVSRIRGGKCTSCHNERGIAGVQTRGPLHPDKDSVN